MLTICTYLWGDRYGIEDVAKLRAGIRRHLQQRHAFVVITDRPHLDLGLFDAKVLGIPEPDLPLTKIKGCFARLRLFDPLYQENIEIVGGAFERLVCVDLDVVVTGALDPLFNRPDNFTILTGANAKNPCPYNGSVWQLRAGYRPDVWRDFSLEAAARVPYFEFPDDQAWFADRLPGVVGWKVGSPSGIYAFQKPGWPKGDALPADARLVVFPGWRSPARFAQLPWVAKHWSVAA